MPIDFEALDEFTRDEAKGTGIFFSQKEIDPKKDTVIRLIPSARLEPYYFFKEFGYWINKVYYVSPLTFGGTCPIAEEVVEAKSSGDPTLMNLLNSKLFNDRPTYFLPCLVLDENETKGARNITYTVRDERVKLLQCGKQLMTAINKIVTSPRFRNVENGILSRTEGFCIILTKEGEGQDTKYGASLLPGDVPVFDERYYEEENIPDPVTLSRERIQPDDVLRAAIQEFLYGKKQQRQQTSSAQRQQTSPAQRQQTSNVVKQPTPTKSLLQDLEADDTVPVDEDDLPF